jgi:hypothetical protein
MNSTEVSSLAAHNKHQESVLVVTMDDIKSNIKVWLDDCLLHTKTEDDLLVFCRPDEFCRNSYVDDNNPLISE